MVFKVGNMRIFLNQVVQFFLRAIFLSIHLVIHFKDLSGNVGCNAERFIQNI